jgi:hypothetical protein
MAEPENRTLHLLREFREESRAFQTRVDLGFVRLGEQVASISAELSQVKDKLETLTRAVAGEIVQARYVTAGVDERFAAIEQRLAALEESR